MNETIKNEDRPTWKIRLLAASFYCGSAPLLGRLRARRENAYAEHHYKQALSVHLVLQGVILLYFAFSLFLSYALVFERQWYEGTPLEPVLLMIVRRAFLCWLVVWAFATFWALGGSWRDIPLVGRLARRETLMKISMVGYSALMVSTLVAVSATVHASTLTRNDDEPASVYMLYHDMGMFPRWLFNLGFYPISRAAISRWGEDSVVVAPLTKDALGRAIRDGKFVFVLSHGTERGLYTSSFRVRPRDSAPLGVGDDLQLVYITGCDSGTLAKEWEETLAPAEVITFDRLSAWVEHIYWLLFKGARQVRTLK